MEAHRAESLTFTNGCVGFLGHGPIGPLVLIQVGHDIEMPTDAVTVIAYVGAFVGLVGGGVSLFNTRKAVLWKRPELANTYLKDFNNNPELVFAGRCLDWNGGKLVVPENLLPYMPEGEKIIYHDRGIFAKALSPDLKINDMNEDPRIQIYRTSMDSFLTWMSLVASALDRKPFLVEDLQDTGYWVAKIQSEAALHAFIVAYGYKENLERLIHLYRTETSAYKDWVFPRNISGDGQPRMHKAEGGGRSSVSPN